MITASLMKELKLIINGCKKELVTELILSNYRMILSQKKSVVQNVYFLFMSFMFVFYLFSLFPLLISYILFIFY